MEIQKQSSRGAFRKSCSGNIQKIYKRALMPECDFNKVAKHLWKAAAGNLVTATGMELATT